MTIEQQRQELEKQKQQLAQAKSKIPTQTQAQLRQPNALQGRLQRQQYQQQREQLAQQEQQLAQQEQQLQAYQENIPELARKARKQIKSEMERIRTKSEYYSTYAGQRLLKLSDEDLVEEYYSGKPVQIGYGETVSKEKVKQQLTPNLTTQGEALGMSIAPELLTEEQRGKVAKYEAKQYFQNIANQGMSVAPISTVTLPKQTSDKLTTEISKYQQQREQLTQKRQLGIKENIQLVNIGIASSFLGTAQAVKQGINKPIETIIEVGKNIIYPSKTLSSAVKTIKEEPSYALGYGSAEAFQIKLLSPKVKVKQKELKIEPKTSYTYQPTYSLRKVPRTQPIYPKEVYISPFDVRINKLTYSQLELPKVTKIALQKVKQTSLIEKAKTLRQQPLKLDEWKLSQLKARIRANPELLLPKARQIALQKVKKTTQQKVKQTIGEQRLAQLRQAKPIDIKLRITKEIPKKSFKVIRFEEPKIPKGSVLKPTSSGAVQIIKTKLRKPKVITKQIILEIEKPKLVTKQRYKETTAVQTFQAQKQREENIKVRTLTAYGIKTKQAVKTDVTIIQKPKVKQDQQQERVLVLPKVSLAISPVEKIATATKITPKLKTGELVIPKPRLKTPTKQSQLQSQKNIIKLKQRARLERLYRLYLKRKGKYSSINRLLTRGEALKLGQEITTSTLGASFKVTPTSKFTTRQDTQFQPSKEQFRTFRIKGGKRVPLKDEFIQRRGKRLSSKSEISSIQRARSKKWTGF